MQSPAQPLPEGHVTFLFTDIEGSTPLLERLGAERYGEVLGIHRGLFSSAPPLVASTT